MKYLILIGHEVLLPRYMKLLDIEKLPYYCKFNATGPGTVKCDFFMLGSYKWHGVKRCYKIIIKIKAL